MKVLEKIRKIADRIDPFGARQQEALRGVTNASFVMFRSAVENKGLVTPEATQKARRILEVRQEEPLLETGHDLTHLS